MDELVSVLNGGDCLIDSVIREALEKRILIINQEIDDSIVESYVYYILKWNMEDTDKPVDKRKRIKVIINSPGGDVIVGMGLVDMIKASSTPIDMIGIGLVASMSYYIYICGDKRYALRNTVLLQHDGEISISNSGSKAKDTMDFIDEMGRRTKELVLSNTKISEELYDSRYEKEYYFYPDEAKEIGVVDYIIGEDVSLEEVFA